ncbi:MAG: CpaF family protein, partial [Pacificimonas sp.]
ALNLVVQISRMRDGGRRITHISEVVGMEGDVITMQDLFTYQFTHEDDEGKLCGEFKSSGMRPACYERAEYFGLGRVLMETVS